MPLHCYRTNGAGCVAGAAAVTDRRIRLRPGHTTNPGTEADRSGTTCFATHPAFDATIGKARISDTNLQRPRHILFRALQGPRFAHLLAITAEGALTGLEGHRREAAIARAQDAGRASPDALLAAVTPEFECAAPDRPGGADLVNRGRKTTSQEGTAGCRHFRMAGKKYPSDFMGIQSDARNHPVTLTAVNMRTTTICDAANQPPGTGQHDVDAPFQCITAMRRICCTAGSGRPE